MLSDRVAQETSRGGTVSLLQLVDILRGQESPHSVVCEAKVTKLTQKPRIKNGQWQVKAEVIDGTNQLDVTFNDEVR